MADLRNSAQEPGARSGKQMDGMVKAALIITLISLVLALGMLVYVKVAIG